jgi:hypothetical protein
VSIEKDLTAAELRVRIEEAGLSLRKSMTPATRRMIETRLHSLEEELSKRGKQGDIIAVDITIEAVTKGIDESIEQSDDESESRWIPGQARNDELKEEEEIMKRGRKKRNVDAPKKRGRKSAPVSGESSPVAITIDMARYPRLQGLLVDMAAEELRTPENQLTWLVRNELAKMEEAFK